MGFQKRVKEQLYYFMATNIISMLRIPKFINPALHSPKLQVKPDSHFPGCLIVSSNISQPKTNTTKKKNKQTPYLPQPIPTALVVSLPDLPLLSQWHYHSLICSGQTSRNHCWFLPPSPHSSTPDPLARLFGSTYQIPYFINSKIHDNIYEFRMYHAFNRMPWFN